MKENYNRKYYQKNRDVLCEKKRIYYQENRSDILTKKKEYSAKPEVRKKQQERWLYNHEHEQQRHRDWRNNNKDHNKKRQQKWFNENRERARELAADWRMKNKDRTILTSVKQRAKNKGIDFNLTLEDINIPDCCPVFGVLFEEKGRYGPSIDRIDSNKGYVKGNIQFMSFLANTMKNDATDEELIKFAEWIIREIKLKMKDHSDA